MELHELHERVRQFERNRKKERPAMESVRPIYDRDGQILFYEADRPEERESAKPEE